MVNMIIYTSFHCHVRMLVSDLILAIVTNNVSDLILAIVTNNVSDMTHLSCTHPNKVICQPVSRYSKQG